MSRRDRREPLVRPETVALARARAEAGASLTTPSQLEPEQQVWLLKGVARHLWHLLENRQGDCGTPSAESVWGEMEPDAWAAVDRSFEAMLVLWARDRIHVEPCRRILERQRADSFQYLLQPLGGGEPRVVNEEQLLMMAGV